MSVPEHAILSARHLKTRVEVDLQRRRAHIEPAGNQEADGPLFALVVALDGLHLYVEQTRLEYLQSSLEGALQFGLGLFRTGRERTEIGEAVGKDGSLGFL